MKQLLTVKKSCHAVPSLYDITGSRAHTIKPGTRHRATLIDDPSSPAAVPGGTRSASRGRSRTRRRVGRRRLRAARSSSCVTSTSESGNHVASMAWPSDVRIPHSPVLHVEVHLARLRAVDSDRVEVERVLSRELEPDRGLSLIHISEPTRPY